MDFTVPLSKHEVSMLSWLSLGAINHHAPIWQSTLRNVCTAAIEGQSRYDGIIYDSSFSSWHSDLDVLVQTCSGHHENDLTHWGRVTHICVSELTIIGSDNGLSPGRRQAIIWTNAGILLIGPSGTNFSEILIEILAFSLKKMRLKVLSAKWRPFCVGLNVLRK